MVLLALALALAGLLLTIPPPAPAHVTEASGSLRVTMGWGNEPPLTGLENFVEAAVSDASGAPVTDLGAAAEVEVSFGDARITLPLRKVAGASAKRGAKIRFKLTEAAKVRFKARRIGGGASVKFRRTFKAGGKKKVKFTGRFRGGTLPPGLYRLTAAATDNTGLRSRKYRTQFRIVS